MDVVVGICIHVSRIYAVIGTASGSAAAGMGTRGGTPG
jgi:hypothetical protein